MSWQNDQEAAMYRRRERQRVRDLKRIKTFAEALETTHVTMDKVDVESDEEDFSDITNKFFKDSFKDMKKEIGRYDEEPTEVK